MKRMLINAQIPEELRIVTVANGKITALDIENLSQQSQKSNIYKGTVARVMASLEAAFVDFGSSRYGFLPFREIAPQYLSPPSGEENGEKKPTIEQSLPKGTEMIVQVVKDELGTKGAALTTFISLAGRYTVLLPRNPETDGVSRRLPDDERAQLREITKDLQVADKMGYIVRTASLGTSGEALQWDLNYLCELWADVEKTAQEKPKPCLLLQEGNALLRAVRDNFQDNIDEILIDSDDAFTKVKEFIASIVPHNADRVHYYEESVPLFAKYEVERQLEELFQRQVKLPSGGSIVIDHTEALTAIDVNSAQAKFSQNIEDTALQTNLEAMAEIARQVRLRQIGGLLVIDCIDMTESANMQKVRDQLQKSMQGDPARVRIGKVSPFGLLELTRQKIRPSLQQICYIPCSNCQSTGSIRNASALCFHLLRQLEARLMKMQAGGRLQLRCSLSMGTYLLNEKRLYLQMLEERYFVHIFVVPDYGLHDNNFHLQAKDKDSARKNDTRDYESVQDMAKQITNKILTDVKPKKRPEALVEKHAAGASIPFVSSTPVRPPHPPQAPAAGEKRDRSSSSRRRRRSRSRSKFQAQKQNTSWLSRVFSRGKNTKNPGRKAEKK